MSEQIATTNAYPHTQFLVSFHCYKCGIVFGVPKVFADYRRRDGRSFWCPNGHGQSFTQKSEKPLEQRQAEILKLHEQEQEEARQADAGNKPANSAPPESPAAAPTNQRLFIRYMEDIGRWKCPCCDLTYKKLGTALDWHLRRRHKIDPREVATEHPDE